MGAISLGLLITAVTFGCLYTQVVQQLKKETNFAAVNFGNCTTKLNQSSVAYESLRVSFSQHKQSTEEAASSLQQDLIQAKEILRKANDKLISTDDNLKDSKNAEMETKQKLNAAEHQLTEITAKLHEETLRKRVIETKLKQSEEDFTQLKLRYIQMQQTKRSYLELVAQTEASLQNCLNYKNEREKIDVAYCPENWYPHNNKCYYISEEKMNWESSQRFCVSSGSSLAMIKDKETMAFIAKKRSVIKAWIGLQRETKYRQFIWLDGSKEDHKNIWDFKGHCGELDFRQKNLQMASWCTYEMNCICEKDMVYLQFAQECLPPAVSVGKNKYVHSQ
ncbi:oxidized low-density lipoprotein receptor 1-like [Protopterus annectens]|uniref:oxidized low-density lipoprotein receptor 1-like n=1 Tax=Protopterus annectens TaxID=7888 RepID=UPI001CFA1B8C|nr:oxidized low-density lipoprotein receptor 1-like [Protopterus annectens]